MGADVCCTPEESGGPRPSPAHGESGQGTHGVPPVCPDGGLERGDPQQGGKDNVNDVPVHATMSGSMRVPVNDYVVHGLMFQYTRGGVFGFSVVHGTTGLRAV